MDNHELKPITKSTDIKPATDNTERKKLNKIVTGNAKRKEPNKFTKFITDIFGEDLDNVKSYIVKDVIIPSVKKGISDTVDVVLFGDTRGRKSVANKVSYRSFYDEPSRSRDARSEVRYTGRTFDDVILETRGDAENVLSQLTDILDTYGVVSVSDLYELVGLDFDYTANRYGWNNLRNVEIRRVRDGYLLDMPKALPIK